MDSFQWITDLFRPPVPALSRMRLAPPGSKTEPLMLQFFTWDALHPTLSWWAFFEEKVPRIAELGFTQVWLPPPNKAAARDGRGYDVYDLWDLGEFNHKGNIATRWGTREELLKACDAAKRHGIDILIDGVLNHKLGADRKETFSAIPVDNNNRLKEIGKARKIDGWTAFDFPGRGNKYSSMKWNKSHFTGLDWDARTRSKGVYRMADKKWSQNVDSELGNYDYLLGVDIDHRHPAVVEDLKAWGPWVLEQTGSSGFRLDAIKHMDYKFLMDFIKTVRHQRGDPEMFAVAELWSGDLRAVLPYVKRFRGETAFFDVPLHMNLHNASKKYSQYDLRAIFRNSLVDVRPHDAVTFVDNHDTVPGQSLESWVQDNFKAQAYALILLRGIGHPCVFFGDLWPNKECYNETTSKAILKILEARQLMGGKLTEYSHEKNCVGFVREGDGSKAACAVLISNAERERVHTIRMSVGKINSGALYRSFMTQHGEITVGEDGYAEFTCFSNSVQIWLKA
ncbi:glycoside hydrolase family 13 protein [Flagelloscypha sp. PMI_526]|nr:glycoside hydrolase family 13 protein [Flagelloscypha sp. PMI_526]